MPPFTEKIVQVQFKGVLPNTQVVNNLASFKNKYGVCVAQGPIECPTNTLNIILSNLTATERTIPKFTEVAKLIPLDDYDIMSSNQSQRLTSLFDCNSSLNTPLITTNMPCRETNPLKNHSIEVENIDFNVNELTPIQVKLASELLKTSADIFAATNPGTTHLVNHHIDVGDSLPVHSIPYRTSPKEREIIQTEVDKMLKAKVIQPSRSPWEAPIVLITKKDGSIRFCIDYRKLNLLTTDRPSHSG